MGYYTAYNINYTIPEGEDKEKFSQKLAFVLRLCATNKIFNYTGNCTIEDLIESEMMTWYDYEKDMCKLSELFPNVLFTIEGFGEDQGDMWREYFYNGKFQYTPAIIVFDEFDESKLKELSV